MPDFAKVLWFVGITGLELNVCILGEAADELATMARAGARGWPNGANLVRTGSSGAQVLRVWNEGL